MRLRPPKKTDSRVSPPAEGDLYKVVTTFGRTFELRYGYYADIDRTRPPDVIYPDFSVTPLFTEEGAPFVTMMQDACPCFRGATRRTEDSTCAECRYFRRGEEWFGLCAHPDRQRPYAGADHIHHSHSNS